jgi:hypothetical protein
VYNRWHLRLSTSSHSRGVEAPTVEPPLEIMASLPKMRVPAHHQSIKGRSSPIAERVVILQKVKEVLLIHLVKS